jgi:alanine-glyoxylate transaminase / serine-glyoxylate transaminase / serine-pyruvate transaminase
LLYGLREAIALFIENGGLEASWKRYEIVSKRLYSSLESNGFELFLKDVKTRVPSVTSVIIPAGVDQAQVSSYAMDKYKFEISGGLGPTAGKVFRIGLMGMNATEALVDKTIEILLEAIKNGKMSSKL